MFSRRSLLFLLMPVLLAGGGAPPSDNIAAAIAGLADADFATRMAARVALEKIGPRAMSALRAASLSTDPEVAAQAQAALRNIPENAVLAITADAPAAARDLIREIDRIKVESPAKAANMTEALLTMGPAALTAFAQMHCVEQPPPLRGAIEGLLVPRTSEPFHDALMRNDAAYVDAFLRAALCVAELDDDALRSYVDWHLTMNTVDAALADLEDPRSLWVLFPKRAATARLALLTAAGRDFSPDDQPTDEFSAEDCDAAWIRRCDWAGLQRRVAARTTNPDDRNIACVLPFIGSGAVAPDAALAPLQQHQTGMAILYLAANRPDLVQRWLVGQGELDGAYAAAVALGDYSRALGIVDAFDSSPDNSTRVWLRSQAAILYHTLGEDEKCDAFLRAGLTQAAEPERINFIRAYQSLNRPAAARNLALATICTGSPSDGERYLSELGLPDDRPAVWFWFHMLHDPAAADPAPALDAAIAISNGAYPAADLDLLARHALAEPGGPSGEEANELLGAFARTGRWADGQHFADQLPLRSDIYSPLSDFCTQRLGDDLLAGNLPAADQLLTAYFARTHARDATLLYMQGWLRRKSGDTASAAALIAAAQRAGILAPGWRQGAAAWLSILGDHATAAELLREEIARDTQQRAIEIYPALIAQLAGAHEYARAADASDQYRACLLYFKSLGLFWDPEILVPATNHYLHARADALSGRYADAAAQLELSLAAGPGVTAHLDELPTILRGNGQSAAADGLIRAHADFLATRAARFPRAAALAKASADFRARNNLPAPATAPAP